MKNVFNSNTVNQDTKHYMFFGDLPNIARYDVLHAPLFDKSTNTQLSFFWRPEEIDVTKDALDVKNLSPSQLHIFTKTISSQIALDTVQGRSPVIALLPHASLSELATCITTWSFYEDIHNRTYSHILKNIYTNPSEVFDEVHKDIELVDRIKLTTKYYDDFLTSSIDYQANGEKNISLSELKYKLLLCVVSINALEGLSFYASFACSFAFDKIGLFSGVAKLIGLIARDEALHLAITQNIIKRWSSGVDDPEMVLHYNTALQNGDIKKIYDDVLEKEREWCKYLFKNGVLLGLNEQILIEYVEYMCGKRLKFFSIKHTYSTKNPLPWMDEYLFIDNKQTASQEAEQLSYTIGGMINDITSTDFTDFRS